MINYIYRAENITTVITMTETDNHYRVTLCYKNKFYRGLSNSFETDDFGFAEKRFFEYCEQNNMKHLIRKF